MNLATIPNVIVRAARVAVATAMATILVTTALVAVFVGTWAVPYVAEVAGAFVADAWSAALAVAGAAFYSPAAWALVLCCSATAAMTALAMRISTRRPQEAP